MSILKEVCCILAIESSHHNKFVNVWILAFCCQKKKSTTMKIPKPTIERVKEKREEVKIREEKEKSNNFTY